MRALNTWLLAIIVASGCGNMVGEEGGRRSGCENLDGDTNPDGSQRCDGVDDPIVVDPSGYVWLHISVLPASATLGTVFSYGNGFGTDPTVGNDWCDPVNPAQMSEDGTWFREYLPDFGGMTQYYMTMGVADACESGDFAHWANFTGDAASSDEALVESECGDGYAVCVGWVSGMLIATGDCDRVNDVCSDI